MAKRAKNLSDDDIRLVVEVLDGWTGKLSWELLIDAVAKRLGSVYTRQALHKHERIRLAFVGRKQSLAGGASETKVKGVPVEVQKALERIARLEAKTARLEAENQRLLEQFARWAYNAHTRGLDEFFLNRPLPFIDRDRTPSNVKNHD